jgi:hypothetical protein
VVCCPQARAPSQAEPTSVRQRSEGGVLLQELQQGELMAKGTWHGPSASALFAESTHPAASYASQLEMQGSGSVEVSECSSADERV